MQPAQPEHDTERSSQQKLPGISSTAMKQARRGSIKQVLKRAKKPPEVWS
jgi:hypothetical protein